ncbi:hypothetical protein [uncultured Aquimarina sp.]|uniref:hypothetical protein n=1 Tax=uncultured Aquimarina sp. TaxID=575652 RepID=UPI002607F3AA|nr:hypothetical protein [uncultured Aquimarina sp.]
MKKITTSKLLQILGVFLSIMIVTSCDNNQEELSFEEDSIEISTASQKTTTLPNRFQFYCGASGNDRIISSNSITGTGSWTSGRYVPGAGLTKTHISGTQYGSRVAIVYRGRSNTGKIYYTISNNGTDFSTERTVPGALTSNKGLIRTVSKNGELYVFHTGKTSTGRIFMSKFNGTSWTTSRPVTPSMSFNDFDIIEKNGVFLLAMMGSVHLNYLRSVDGLNFQDLNINISIPFPEFQSPGNALDIAITSRTDSRRLNHVVIRTDKNEMWTSSFGNSLIPNTFQKVEVRPRDYAKTDQRPGIATNGTQVILVYEGNSSSNIYYAFRNGFFWSQTKTGIKTKNSGVDLLYIN